MRMVFAPYYTYTLSLIFIFLGQIPSFAFQAKFSFPKILSQTNQVFTFDNGNDFPLDSTYLNRLERTPNDLDLAKAYEISHLILTRKKSNACRLQYYKFESVTARMQNDTLILTFITSSKYATYNNKLLEIAITKDGCNASLFHSRSKHRTLEDTNGEEHLVSALKSNIEDLQIELNTADFHKNQILKGKLKMESSYLPSSRASVKSKEKISGEFRCIIQ